MLSIIAPCYNEEKNISDLSMKFSEVFRKINFPAELILVNNGSTDCTKDAIIQQSKYYDFIRLVDVKINKGYGYGILAGLNAAKGDYIGWMHADLQSDPKIFINMLADARRETRFFLYKGRRKNRPFLDTVFTLLMSIFESLYFHTLLWDINAQPTLLSRGLYESWQNPPFDFSLDLYSYVWAKYESAVIKKYDSPQRNRKHGMSSWNTGMKSRIRLIKGVLLYSKELKYKCSIIK